MNSYYNSRKPKRSDFLWKKEPEGSVTLRTVYNQWLVSLGPMGIDVFECCDGKTAISQILEIVKAKYPQIPGTQIEHDTYVFLHWLQSLGVVLVYWEEF